MFAPDKAALRREYQLAERQLSYESQRREELYKLLEQEKTFHVVPPEHSQALSRRNDDVMRIKEEIAAMQQWLQRGVSEAQKLSAAASTLPTILIQSRSLQTALREDKARLTETIHQLELEHASLDGTELQLSEEEKGYHDEIQRILSGSSLTIREAKGARDHVKELEEELRSLILLDRQVERVQQAAGNLSAGTRRFRHSIEVLHKQAAGGGNWVNYFHTADRMEAEIDHHHTPTPPLAGNNEDEPEEDDFDSEDEAERTMATAAVCAGAKATLSRADSTLLALQSILVRFDADEVQRRAHANQRQRDLAQQMKAELNDLQLRSEHHLTTLRTEYAHREPLLLRYSHLRSDAMRRNEEKVLASVQDGARPQSGPLDLEKPFNLYEFLVRENDELLQQNQSLRREQDKMRATVEEMEEDFASVHELRHTYRQLEAQKTLLSLELRTEEKAKEELKQVAWETGAFDPVTPFVASDKRRVLLIPGGAKEGRSRTPKKLPPWKATKAVDWSR